MRGTDGPPCPFSKTVDTGYSIKMHDVFQSLLSAGVDSYDRAIMSDNALYHVKNTWLPLSTSILFFPLQLPVSCGTDFSKLLQNVTI